MRALLVVLAALVLLGGTAVTADARIVPGRSIGGVALGDTLAQVTARLGPADRRLVGDEPVDYTLLFARRRLQVNLLDHEVTEEPADIEDTVYLVSTRSSSERTAAGVRVGLTGRTARRRLRGERCVSIYDVDFGRQVSECEVRAGDGATTSATISRGRRARVLAITIAAASS